MAAREEVDDDTRQRVFRQLGEVWLATPAMLAKELGLSEPLVASALAGWVQAGRAIYDLEAGVYRKRELTREPLPAAALRFASEREAEAARLLHDGKIAIDEVNENDGQLRVSGRLQFRGRVTPAWFLLDAERRMVEAECSCDYFIRNRLRRGPCDHLLALRAAQRRGSPTPSSCVPPNPRQCALEPPAPSTRAPPSPRPRAGPDSNG